MLIALVEAASVVCVTSCATPCEISFGPRNPSANDGHLSAGGLCRGNSRGRILEHQAFADAHAKALRAKQESLRVWFAVLDVFAGNHHFRDGQIHGAQSDFGQGARCGGDDGPRTGIKCVDESMDSRQRDDAFYIGYLGFEYPLGFPGNVHARACEPPDRVLRSHTMDSCQQRRDIDAVSFCP